MSVFNIPVGSARVQSVVIPAASTTSEVIVSGGMSLVGIALPAIFTGTALTFSVCDTVDGTFLPLHTTSGQLSITVAQNRYYAIPQDNFRGVRFFRIISGSTEAAARTLTISLKGL